MKIEVCEKVCENCPFRRENSGKLYKDAVKTMVEKNIVSPCHMDMVKYTGCENKGVELYAQIAPAFKVCRGYALARVRDGFSHNSKVWMHIDNLLELHPHPSDDNIDLITLEEI